MTSDFPPNIKERGKENCGRGEKTNSTILALSIQRQIPPNNAELELLPDNYARIASLGKKAGSMEGMLPGRGKMEYGGAGGSLALP